VNKNGLVIDVTGPLIFSCRRALPSSPGRPLFADVLGAFDCGVAGPHSTLKSPGLNVPLGSLQALLPLTLGNSADADQVQSDPHLCRPQPLRAEPMVGWPADTVSEAEFDDRVCDPIQ